MKFITLKCLQCKSKHAHVFACIHHWFFLLVGPISFYLFSLYCFIFRGLCKNGVCLNYCVLRDKVPCICSKGRFKHDFVYMYVYPTIYYFHLEMNYFLLWSYESLCMLMKFPLNINMRFSLWWYTCMYYKASPLQSFALLESGYACYRCCKVRNESECLPEPPPPALSQKLPNGRPCFHGVCVEVSIYQYIKMVLILTKLSVQFRYCHDLFYVYIKCFP